MSDYPAEASIAEMKKEWNSAVEAGGGIRTKLPFKNVQGIIKNIEQTSAKSTRYGEFKWLHKATLTDETGEIKVALWNDQKVLLNNNDFVRIPSAEVAHFADWTNNNEGVIQVSNARGTRWRVIPDMQGFAICWSSDEGKGKIQDFKDFLKKHSKLLWGVNWGIEKEKLQSINWPIKGYIYYKYQIIALAKITDFTPHSVTKFTSHVLEGEAPYEEIDLRSAGTSAGYPSDYKNYIHIEELDLLEKPFSNKNLELFDDTKKMPDVVQQHVYVKELNHKSDDTSADREGESEMLIKIMLAAGEIEK